MPVTGFTREVAEFTASAAYSDFPTDAVALSKQHILDTFAVGIAESIGTLLTNCTNLIIATSP
jgi:2-methylcitrate dehydratase PrpD